jgi:hypothetical protein
MLVAHRLGFGDAVSDLSACVSYPQGCLDSTMYGESQTPFSSILSAATSLAPSRQVLDLLNKGLTQGATNCLQGGNGSPFCFAAPSVISAMAYHAAANPDVAVTYWLNFLDSLFQNDQDTVFVDQQGAKGAFQRIFGAISTILPSVVGADVKNRALLMLKTVSGMSVIPFAASRAQAALNDLAATPTVPTSTPPTTTPSIFVSTTTRNALIWTLVGLATTGVLAYATVRYVRRAPRYAVTG